MTNSSNRDFMDELIQLWIHPKDHVPSYLHMVYRRKFRFWSLEHITIFSLAHVHWDSGTTKIAKWTLFLNDIVIYIKWIPIEIRFFVLTWGGRRRKQKGVAVFLSIIWENWLVWWQLYKYSYNWEKFLTICLVNFTWLIKICKDKTVWIYFKLGRICCQGKKVNGLETLPI